MDIYNSLFGLSSLTPYLLLILGFFLYLKGDTPQKKKIGKFIILAIIGLHILGIVLLIIAFGICLMNYK